MIRPRGDGAHAADAPPLFARLSLARASLDAADPRSASGVPALAVETCQCPSGYGGTSCEVSPSLPRPGGRPRSSKGALPASFWASSRVFQVFTGWAEFCLEETACAANATATPPTATPTAPVWSVAPPSVRNESDSELRRALRPSGLRPSYRRSALRRLPPRFLRRSRGRHGGRLPALRVSSDGGVQQVGLTHRPFPPPPRKAKLQAALSRGSFSPTCTLDSFGLVSCDRCQEGYAGSKCHE